MINGTMSGVAAAHHHHHRPDQQAAKDLTSLGQAIGSGDVTAAQKAFQALTGNLNGATTGVLASKLAAVGKALQSGDLAAAQKAVSRLQSDARSTSIQPTATQPASDPDGDGDGSSVNISA